MGIDSLTALFSKPKADSAEGAPKADATSEARRKRNLLAMAKGRGGARTGTLGNPDIVQAGLTSAKQAKTGG